jgi:NTP pyrophosphatase (non-canonical NTP hydrolase)
MSETEQSVVLWADETFGMTTSNIRIAARANEEMAELLRALSTNDVSPKAAEEIADIVIILTRLARNLGTTVASEIDAKMQVNRLRRWMKDNTGHGYHVRDKATAP